MKKSIVFIAIMALLYPNVNAQSDVDALRYSLVNPFGTTARSMGMGGAVGALGADAGAVLVNPAGLAQFKTNQFSITAGSANSYNESSYLGNNANTTRFNAELPSINLVWTQRKMDRRNPSKKGWVNKNFSLGYHKTANFNRSLKYAGNNTSNSYLDGVADFVQGVDAGALDANQEQIDRGFYYFENMFWYGFLIDSASNGNYFGNYNNANMYQEGWVKTEGGAHELNASFAANYEHKFFLGGGVSLHRVRYSETKDFYEENLDGGDWSNFDFERELTTKGYGFSGRLGAMFVPNANVRIGGTIQTATIHKLNDVYQDQLFVQYSDNTTENMQTVEGNFDYTIRTPMKYGLQGAYIFGKKGLVSAEIESLHYGTMSVNSDGFDFDNVNDQIIDNYQNSINLKLGGEYVFNEFRVRAGYAHQGSPFANDNAYKRNLVSVGLGMQERKWGFDFAAVKDLTNDEYTPYNVSGMEVSPALNSFDMTRLTFTVTSKF